MPGTRVPRNTGTRVPRNTRWSFSALVAEFGEDAALEMLQYMPGLGGYAESAYTHDQQPEAERRRSHHAIDPGDWMARDLSTVLRNVRRFRVEAHPSQMKPPLPR